MDEEEKIAPQQLEEVSDKPDEWLSFKTNFEELTSKVHVRKDFYEKTKLNSKKMRCNKKNPTKSHSNSGESPMLHTISEDKIYQTAIPNTVPSRT